MEKMRVMVVGGENLTRELRGFLEMVCDMQLIGVVTIENFVSDLADIARLPLLGEPKKFQQPARPTKNGRCQAISGLTGQPRPRPRFQAKRAQR